MNGMAGCIRFQDHSELTPTKFRDNRAFRSASSQYDRHTQLSPQRSDMHEWPRAASAASAVTLLFALAPEREPVTCNRHMNLRQIRLGPELLFRIWLLRTGKADRLVGLVHGCPDIRIRVIKPF